MIFIKQVRNFVAYNFKSANTFSGPHLFQIHIDYVEMGMITMRINRPTDLILGKPSYVDRLNDKKRYDVIINNVSETFKTFDQARRRLYDQLILRRPYFVFSTGDFLPIDKNIIKLYTQNDQKISSLTSWFDANKQRMNFIIQEKDVQQNNDPQKQAELLKAIFEKRNLASPAAAPMQKQTQGQASSTNARSRQKRRGV